MPNLPILKGPNRIGFVVNFLLLWIFAFSALVFPAAAIAVSVPYPVIDFKYDWRGSVMDFFGSWVFDAPMEDLRTQMGIHFPKFIDAWEKDAPVLFGEVVVTFHKGFDVLNRTAVINLSHGNSYGSSRVLVVGLRWLLTPSWEHPIAREEAFSALMFHELLHVWIDGNLSKDRSLLLAKYSQEDSLVLDHLHLMAIQKMVYVKIHRHDMLAYIDT